MGKKLEALAAIKMVEIDNNVNLIKKPEAYYQKQILMFQYEKQMINQDTYFNAMVRLSGKNPSPFPLSGKISTSPQMSQINFIDLS